MIIYEVNLEVDDDINHKMAGWLPGHIEKLCTMKGFNGAHWYFRRPEDEGKQTGRTLWTIHYLVESRQDLDNYLNGHAESMRQEAFDKFGDKFSASRRILNLLTIAGYGPPDQT
ncbi:MAG: DUF4286 family protein [Cyanobacteria bacterium]|nr:DUF4286 family protein [Cyanobacteriota bacterium]